MLPAILNIFIVHYKAIMKSTSSVMAINNMQHCKHAPHSLNIQSCFSFKSVPSIASLIYDIPNPNQCNLPICWCLSYCGYNKTPWSKGIYGKVLFLYVPWSQLTERSQDKNMDVGTLSKSMKKMLITGFMPILSTVFFHIPSRTTCLQVLLSIDSRVTIY